MVIDVLANWSRYASFPRLRQAFELLVSPAAGTWPEGRIELQGTQIVAMPQSYLTKAAADCRFEGHRRYLDIQYMVAGAEKMGWAPIAALTETVAYDGEKDVAFYRGAGEVFTVSAGMFTLFYPEDAHMPCMQAGAAAERVRKIVMKVALD